MNTLDYVGTREKFHRAKRYWHQIKHDLTKVFSYPFYCFYCYKGYAPLYLVQVVPAPPPPPNGRKAKGVNRVSVQEFDLLWYHAARGAHAYILFFWNAVKCCTPAQRPGLVHVIDAVTVHRRYPAVCRLRSLNPHKYLMA